MGKALDYYLKTFKPSFSNYIPFTDEDAFREHLSVLDDYEDLQIFRFLSLVYQYRLDKLKVKQSKARLIKKQLKAFKMGADRLADELQEEINEFKKLKPTKQEIERYLRSLNDGKLSSKMKRLKDSI